MFGSSLPSWLLNQSTVLLRRFVRNKDDPLCDPVELFSANPTYARIKYPSGRESTVSTSDLAPYPFTEAKDSEDATDVTERHRVQEHLLTSGGDGKEDDIGATIQDASVNECVDDSAETTEIVTNPASPCIDAAEKSKHSLRRSTRVRKPPPRYGECVA